MIDLKSEAAIALADAAKLVKAARKGKRTYFSTILRWVTNGAKGPSGEVVRLEALRLGGRWVTSREAIQRFADRLTPQFDRKKEGEAN